MFLQSSDSKINVMLEELAALLPVFTILVSHRITRDLLNSPTSEMTTVFRNFWFLSYDATAFQMIPGLNDASQYLFRLH